MSQPERLQKVLARAGIASRRHAEDLILAGRVRVNGLLVTELGTRVDPRRDKVELDGRRIVLEAPVYAIVHKPRGVVTTLHDPEGRPTLAELVKSLDARVFPIGRLDFHTSGALLVTNDGTLAQALLHPRHHVPKVYVCKVRGVPTDLQLEPWRKGMVLPPTESAPDENPLPTLPAEVHVLRSAPPGVDNARAAGTTWIQVTLREGRTRQIHRMAEATGLFVMRLARLSFADISTEGLRPGELRHLTDKEVTELRVKYLRPLEQGAFAEAPTPPADDDEDAPSPRGPATKHAAPRRRDDAPRDDRPEPRTRRDAPATPRANAPRRDAPASPRTNAPRRDAPATPRASSPRREAPRRDAPAKPHAPRRGR